MPKRREPKPPKPKPQADPDKPKNPYKVWRERKKDFVTKDSIQEMGEKVEKSRILPENKYAIDPNYWGDQYADRYIPRNQQYAVDPTYLPKDSTSTAAMHALNEEWRQQYLHQLNTQTLLWNHVSGLGMKLSEEKQAEEEPEDDVEEIEEEPIDIMAVVDQWIEKNG